MVRYTRLWETMEKRGMSQYRLIRYHGISAGQMRRLKLNMNVSTQTIERLSKGRLRIGMHFREAFLWIALAIIIINFIVKNAALLFFQIDFMPLTHIS